MNKTQLVDTLAARFDGNRKAASHALESVLDTITREVAKGEKVAITGFGSFEKRIREARMVRNPRTGERRKAKKTAVPKFSAGAELKAVVSGARKLPRLTLTATGAAAKAATGRGTTAKAGSTTTRSTAKTTASATGTAAKRSASTTTKTAAKKAAGTSTRTGTKKATGTKSTASKATAAKTSPTRAAAKSTTTTKSTAKKPATKKASSGTTAKKAPAKRAAKKS